MQKMTKDEAVLKYSRDSYGLLKDIEYIFNEDGSINWRQMVPKEFLFPNKDHFIRSGKEIPSTIDGLKDYELCIKLGGIRWLARVRGIISCLFSPQRLDKDYVVMRSSVKWIPNYENPEGAETEDCANATLENCSDFTVKFLETIACNRAFVRAVRSFLGINVVGEDELDKSEKPIDSNLDVDDLAKDNEYSPSNTLRKICTEKSIESFEDFKDVLRKWWQEDIYKNEEVKNWSEFSDIPVKEARKLISLLKKNY